MNRQVASTISMKHTNSNRRILVANNENRESKVHGAFSTRHISVLLVAASVPIARGILSASNDTSTTQHLSINRLSLNGENEYSAPFGMPIWHAKRLVGQPRNKGGQR